MEGSGKKAADARDAVWTYLSRMGETVIELQRQMTRRPAIGPTNGGEGEAEKAAWVAAWCEENGFPEPRALDAPDDRVPAGRRPNLAWVLPGRDASRTLWLVGHLDVVPAGDRSLWQSDPFNVRVDGDTLYGRGVEDNQQGVASALLAFKTLLDCGLAPACNLGILLVSDEETSENLGLPYALGHGAGLFGRHDAFLVPDGGGSDGDRARVAEKSLMWLKIAVSGKQCHASTPEEGCNSLIAAADFILRLEGLYEKFPQRDELFSPPVSTFAPTRMEENVPNINTVPGLDIFYLDCRVLPGIALDDVLAAVRELAAGVEKKYGVRVAVEPLRKEEAPLPTSSDAPVMLALQGALEQMYGHGAEPEGSGGLTVSSQLRGAGHDAIVWSRMYHNPHVPNERSSVAWTLEGAAVMALMALYGLDGKRHGKGSEESGK